MDDNGYFRIGIIGQGFVGSSIKEGMIEDYPNLLTYDIQPELSMCKTLKKLVDECRVIFLCVPTPMRKDGSCYTGIVNEVLEQISNLVTNDFPTIILKTTVPPGTTRQFNSRYANMEIMFNPEFLTEANAVEDFKTQNRIVLGGEDLGNMDLVASIYRKSFPLVPIVYMNPDEAEMVKYITNAFLASKVIFANEMYQICDGLGLNYDRVVDTAKLDSRIGKSHWKVPGPDGDFGYGGHCFPKDLNAIKFEANQKNVSTLFLDSVIQKNDDIRINRNWEKQKGRAVIDK